MANEFPIIYRLEDAQAVAGFRRITAAAVACVAALEAFEIKAKSVNTVLTGIGTRSDKAGTALQGLGTQLGATAGAATNAQGALQGVGNALTPASASAESFGMSMLGLRAGMFVVREVKEALDAMGDSAAAARTHMEQGAEKGLVGRKGAREYANLLGHDSADAEVMKRLFNVQLAGGYKLNEATAYGNQFLGSAPAGLQKGNYGGGKKPGESQEAYEKRVAPIVAGVEKEGAAFGARIGLDAGTAGDLAGVIAQYSKVPDVEAAAGQMGAMAYGLNEGRGAITPLMRAELGAAGSMITGGRFKDLAELGSVVGVASTTAKSATGSGTQVKQADRLFKAMAASKDAEVMALGLSEDDSFVEAMNKVSARLSAPDADRWLKAKGFGNATERDAGRAIASNADIVNQRAAKARTIAKDGKATMEANRRFQLSIGGQNQQGEAVKEIGEYLQTEKFQALVAARKSAVGRLQGEGQLDTADSNFNDWLLDFISGPTRKWAGEQGTHATKIDSEALQGLAESAGKAGIDLQARFPRFIRKVPVSKESRSGVTGSAAMSPEVLADIFSELAPELQAKGLGFIGENAGIKAKVQAGKVPAGPGPQAALGGGAGLRGALAMSMIGAMGEGSSGGGPDMSPTESLLAKILEAIQQQGGGGIAERRGVRPGPDPAAMTPAVAPFRF